MARIFPFQALRYDASRVRPAGVLTQPYDKITPAMQDRYYAASPYNLVRIILGKTEPDDDGSRNLYSRAAAAFAEWRKQGVLRQDAQPAIYVYTQTFSLPGADLRLERCGFIALGQLEDYDCGVVFRHERTLSRPKADRLDLLRATRAHFGQIFMLYSDPAGALDPVLHPLTPPDLEVSDEYGVVHRLWAITDAQTIDIARAKMADKRLIIADGHHRYETALTYRNERRAQAGRTDENAPYERLMMTFVNLEAEGLVILPTHRVVFGLAMFDPEQLLRGAKRYFEVAALDAGLDPAGAASLLAGAGSSGTALIAFTGERNFLFRARPEAITALLPDVSSRQRALDVVVLHRVLLQQVLGISEAAIVEQRNLNYVRDASEAMERVARGNADVAFLMNPVRIDQVRDIAFAGEVLPQKSTDFYPKLLSGLAIYALE